MRLASIITRLFVKRKLKTALILKGGLCLSLPNLIENLSLELFVNGHYEKGLVDYLIASLPPNGVFIDVGANIGAISVFVAKKRPDLMIYAFEASSVVASYLRQNVLMNGLQNVQVINQAVHHSDDIELSFYSPVDQFGKGSMSPVFTKNAETVRTIRLDRFCLEQSLAPDYIKIDVEGFEYFVIDSLGAYLTADKKPVIIFEFVDWAENLSSSPGIGAAQRRLAEAGYRLFDFGQFRKGKRLPLETVICKGSLELIAISQQ